MENNTEKLLEKLAEKLGTTAEKLWHVLIKQARIDACITLFQMLVVGIAVHALIGLHLDFLASGKYAQSEAVALIMGISGFGLSAIAIGFFFCIHDVVNGFLHPEYWALKQILNTIGE